VLWGLDPATGDFKDQEHKLIQHSSTQINNQHLSWFNKLTGLLKPKKKQTVHELLLHELEKLHEELADEKEKFQANQEYPSEREKAKRLLFLFQKIHCIKLTKRFLRQVLVK
jgi:hypothetical protein